jgi:cellulose synthase/poly-beta-1,6-N-acetylglucosamine synthase-like glycosyltransferase
MVTRAVTRELEAVPAGSPWSFLFFVAVGALTVGILGVDNAVSLAVIAVNVIFIVFLMRHMAFASASRWAAVDLHEAADIENDHKPTVSVLVACHNEELVAHTLVRGMVALDYPRNLLEVFLVDDNSTDGTGELLEELTAQHPFIRLVRRPPDAEGGKSGALNAALELATGEVIVVFDADHVPAPDSVRRLARHFRDPDVGAVQGRCVVRNPDDSALARAVSVDYLSGYLVNEYGRQALFQLPAYGGANCAVRASTLRRLGGWNTDSVTEDTDLTLRVVLTGERVRYDVTAVDTEQAPTTLRRFWCQRYRWARGHQEVWRNLHGDVMRSRFLGLPEKFETLLFLLVYHVPVASFFGLVLLFLRLAGVGHRITMFELLPLSALLFAGPFCELASGLLAGRMPRRLVWTLVWMLPVFAVSILVCTKAWVDGLLGRPVCWIKTQRSATGLELEEARQ